MRMTLIVGVAALLAISSPIAAAEFRVGNTLHHEEPESTAAATAAHCAQWPQAAEYLIQFRMRDQRAHVLAESRRWMTEQKIFSEGRPIVIKVHPYRGEEYRVCSSRQATPDDLRMAGRTATAIVRAGENSINGYAVRKLSERNDTFEFLVAGPVEEARSDLPPSLPLWR